MYNSSSRKYSSSTADTRQQLIDAQSALDEKNKKMVPFMFMGFGFKPQYNHHGNINMDGILCPRQITKDRPCFAALTVSDTESVEASCDVCGATYTLPHGFQRFREIAHRAYEGKLNFEASGGVIQTLDVPYDAIKISSESEDKTRAIEVKWAQKDGRNQAIVYFINKEDNTTGAKPQIFVDMDRQEIRHDARDQRPGEVLAKITATFKNTKAHIEYTDGEKNNPD